MPIPRVALTFALSLLCLYPAGCASPSRQENSPRVAASVSPITNLVANVSAGAIEVAGLVPEGLDSHTFEPAPSQVRQLSDAEVVFVNGLGLEDPIIKIAKSQKTGVVELAAETIGDTEWIFDRSFPSSRQHPNPHLWTNPIYAKKFTLLIRDHLSERFPGHARRFAENQRSLEGKIDQLDRAIRAATATVPPQNRKLLTYHDSFPYFAREYGWEVIGAIQPSDFSEPTPAEVTRLIEQVRAQRVPAIFGSEVFPSKVLAQIAEQTGARYIDDLRDDDLPGKAGDPEHSYLGLMQADMMLMIEALGGDTSALEDLDVTNLPGTRARYAG